MSEKPENPAAFATSAMATAEGEIFQEGMTLRDYFAGQVLAGLLADSELEKSYKEYAEDCYFIADLMLNERGA